MQQFILHRLIAKDQLCSEGPAFVSHVSWYFMEILQRYTKFVEKITVLVRDFQIPFLENFQKCQSIFNFFLELSEMFYFFLEFSPYFFLHLILTFLIFLLIFFCCENVDFS